jgi:hypothetical protein
LRIASAPTSTHSNGFCVIWVCISPSSSSKLHVAFRNCPLYAARGALLPQVCRQEYFFLRAPPDGGACSSWIKHGFSHSLRQRLRDSDVTEKWFGRVG